MEYIITKTKYVGNDSETFEERFEGTAHEIAELLKLTNGMGEIRIGKFAPINDSGITVGRCEDNDIFTLSDMKDFKNEKIAVNCKTKELAISLLCKLEELGIRWEDDCCDLDETEWDNYGENTCYTYDSEYKHLEYSDVDFYKEKGYKIKEFKGW